MNKEVVRQTAAVLADPTHGLLAQIASFAAIDPLTGQDYADGDALPTSVRIGNEADSADVSMGRPEGQGEMLAVSVLFLSLSKIEGVDPTLHHTYAIEIGVRLDSIDSDGPRAITQQSFLMRAIGRVVSWWFSTAPDSYRTRAGVQITNPLSIEAGAFAPATDDGSQTYGAKITLEVRDAAPAIA